MKVLSRVDRYRYRKALFVGFTPSFGLRYTFELASLYHRSMRMHIIRCWNSNPSLPQRVLSHSLRTRYVRLFWVDDRATQKTLVRDPSPSPAR
ncbi:NBS-LRR type resistance protein [Cucumis melo var. makuwa]|uniref:NBS-LRR type resistance protein n=1 Tax=Cucumis melo var. makuwa TaxID=1194695 RepID=A0A5A7UDP1_CUCMM|nr:NBS-LRR type resistance protein [Cucumis melo var. makuwa]